MRTDDRAVVRLDGELDIASADELDEALRSLTDTTQAAPRQIIVDAEQLTFVDASGLGPLLAAVRRCPPGTVRMRGARPSVLRVLTLLDLTGTFGVGA
jgi:anti-anti-sigma factor